MVPKTRLRERKYHHSEIKYNHLLCPWAEELSLFFHEIVFPCDSNIDVEISVKKVCTMLTSKLLIKLMEQVGIPEMLSCSKILGQKYFQNYSCLTWE